MTKGEANGVLPRALPEGLAVLTLPSHHRRPLRTSNAIEVVNREIKRRTCVATLFLPGHRRDHGDIPGPPDRTARSERERERERGRGRERLKRLR